VVAGRSTRSLDVMQNKHGLQRHIPEDMALEIRRRSKFGCVVCRCAIYQYEHIDPEFADAKSHDPDKICLLCGGCHDRVTRGRLSKETVSARYKDVQDSLEIRRPFEELDLSAQSLTVSFGTAKFERAAHLLRINGVDLLSISPPKDGASFPTLNGVFCETTGKEIFRISDNVWEGPTDAWDIRVSGRHVTIKGDGGRTALAFAVSPPGDIVISHLDMYLDNCHVMCGDEGLMVGRIYAGRYAYVGLGHFSCVHSDVGIDVDGRSEEPPIPRSINMTGGKGIALEGTGIRIGMGAPSMLIADLKVWVG
jgi:hypothetical protein